MASFNALKKKKKKAVDIVRKYHPKPEGRVSSESCAEPRALRGVTIWVAQRESGQNSRGTAPLCWT